MNATGSDIVAVLRAPLENYPPSLNQLQILAERGWRLSIIDVAPEAPESHGFWTHPNVNRARSGVQAAHSTFLRKALEHVRFTLAVRKAMRRERPKVVIAYDPYGMVAAGLPSTFKIWHFHEFFDGTAGAGFLTRRAVSYANRNARRADLLIFPDAGRARVFARSAALPTRPEIVCNCPRRLERIPEDRLRPVLRERGVPAEAPVVLFQGWIGPSRCLEPIIASMPAWPRDARLVLIGPVTEEYRKTLESLAAQMNAADQVLFLDRVPYADLLGYTVGADIGLSIISDRRERTLSWRYAAGAINKRFEYMAVGIPQIANRGPGMTELIEETGVGCLVSPEDSAAIGRTISRMLSNPAEMRAMSHRARQAHLTRYCYEVQFAPVVERLERMHK